MAKKKEEPKVEPKEGSEHAKEITKSIGSMMHSKSSQRDRNLAVKAELIKQGVLNTPTKPTGTNREINLANKKLKDGKAKGRKTEE